MRLGPTRDVWSRSTAPPPSSSARRVVSALRSPAPLRRIRRHRRPTDLLTVAASSSRRRSVSARRCAKETFSSVHRRRACRPRACPRFDTGRDPAADIPLHAAAKRCAYVIVNRGATEHDRLRARVVANRRRRRRHRPHCRRPCRRARLSTIIGQRRAGRLWSGDSRLR